MTFEDLKRIYRLKTIIRYNTRPKLTKESVAEHSFYVALIALHIADERGLDDQVKLKILIKALLHDMPETITNDITHDAKLRLNLYEYLKQYEDQFFRDEFPQYAELMTTNDEAVDSVVNLADAYSVLQYSRAEIDLGNKSEEMQAIFLDAQNRVVKMVADYQIKQIKKGTYDA